MHLDVASVRAAVRAVAEEEVLPRFRRLEESDVREKGPNDLVTVADEAAERALARWLLDLVPGSIVIGEEAVAADASVLGRVGEDVPVWIVDPIDGTANFVRGQPTFSIVVALARAGETVAGLIHDPIANRTAVAEKGAGAFLDGRRLAVAAAAAPEAMTGAVSARYFQADVRRHLQKRLAFVGPTFSLHAASHEYLRLIQGEIHFSIYRKIMPWDHAAGTLMHAEAGGYHAKLDGGPYAPTELSGGLLTAPDRDSWRRLRDLLFGD